MTKLSWKPNCYCRSLLISFSCAMLACLATKRLTFMQSWTSLNACWTIGVVGTNPSCSTLLHRFFCCKMYNSNNMQTLGFALYCNSFLPTVRFTIALLLALRYRQCQILKALAWMYQNSTSIRNLYCCFDDFYSIFFLSGSPTTFKRGVDFDTYIISMLAAVLLCFLYCSILWFYWYF